MKVFYVAVFSLALLIPSTVCVKVSVYYEALCSDSTNFIARQLYPNYEKLKEHINLELIPYGKAIHNFINDRWHFQCQHGYNECLGNKYQSCALAENIGQDKDVAFVNCVMRERNPADVKKIEKCANQLQMNWKNISTCAQTTKGEDLLSKNGDKTYDLVPNISFVPTIVYDDQYDDYLQENSLVNFAAVVCSKIKGNKPQFCNNKFLPQNRSFWGYF